jgi:hypothetical protein
MTHAFVRGRDTLAESARHYFSALDRAVAGRRLVVWGAGRAGAIATAALQAAGRPPALIVDRDPRRHGDRLDGVRIGPLDALAHPAGERGDYVLIASMHATEIAGHLEREGWRRGIDFAIFPVGSIYRPEFGFALEQLPAAAARDADRPAPGAEARTDKPTATIFASAAGNFYFRELRHFLAGGLRRAGWTIYEADEGAAAGNGVPIVVGPHEFFSVGAGVEWFSAENLGAAVLVTTEQLQSVWLQLFDRALRLSAAVVDVNPAVSAELAARGVAARWLPLGWYPGCGVFDSVPAGLHAPPDWQIDFQAGPLADAGSDSWHDRPIDILFIGSHSPRRERWLRLLQEALPDRRWFVHLPSDRQPIGEGGKAHVDTAASVALARRSKILLNIHRDDAAYFEWQRIVWRGLWQRTLVVTEPCGSVSSLRAGVDYVEVPLERIAETLRRLLATPQGIDGGDSIRQRGCDDARAIAFADTERVLAEAARRVGGADASGQPAAP